MIAVVPAPEFRQPAFWYHRIHARFRCVTAGQRNSEMSDTYTLHLQNFRSIRDARVEIAPLTVVYGPNGSGKSSLIYGLLTLKNFLTNPSQNLSSLFSYPSISLGGWQEVVHRHAVDKNVSLSIGVSDPEAREALSPKFTLTLSQSGGVAGVDFEGLDREHFPTWPEDLGLQIAIPYDANQQVDANIAVIGNGGFPILEGTLIWNGIALSTQIHGGAVEYADSVRRINERTNLPMELARWTGFVPLRRGFAKPTYGLSSVTPALATEDEVASLLASANERFRQYDISKYIEQIANRRVMTQAQIGTSVFTIDSIPTGSGVPASIVNEGFGINQLLYLLTICLYSPFKIVAIEEPEIHLHPSMVRELARAMVRIAANEDRRLIVSTHSEVFVTALLAQIAAGEASVDDISFILAENRDGESTFTPQQATSDGQITGGLRAFMTSEIGDLAVLLGISDQGNA